MRRRVGRFAATKQRGISVRSRQLRYSNRKSRLSIVYVGSRQYNAGVCRISGLISRRRDVVALHRAKQSQWSISAVINIGRAPASATDTASVTSHRRRRCGQCHSAPRDKHTSRMRSHDIWILLGLDPLFHESEPGVGHPPRRLPGHLTVSRNAVPGPGNLSLERSGFKIIGVHSLNPRSWAQRVSNLRYIVIRWLISHSLFLLL